MEEFKKQVFKWKSDELKCLFVEYLKRNELIDSDLKSEDVDINLKCIVSNPITTNETAGGEVSDFSIIIKSKNEPEFIDYRIGVVKNEV